MILYRCDICKNTTPKLETIVLYRRKFDYCMNCEAEAEKIKKEFDESRKQEISWFDRNLRNSENRLLNKIIKKGRIKMLNKILIKVIINQLLEDTFAFTYIEHTFTIEKKEYYYKIEIIAMLKRNNQTITKTYNLTTNNWVKLIINYEQLRKKLNEKLIDNITEAE